jgi:hypothetical protein
MLVLGGCGRSQGGKRKRARRKEQSRLHVSVSGARRRRDKRAASPFVPTFLVDAVLGMLRAMAFMLGGHVLAAILAAVLVLSRLTLLGLRAAWSLGRRLGGGSSSRDHQRQHDQFS